jgi:hypothetical protein
MLKIQKIDPTNKREIKEFIDLPFRIYQDNQQWVPPIRSDVALMMNNQKHPYYEHSDADFYLVKRDGIVVARIALLENKKYNDYHHTKRAQFYLFESENDLEAVNLLISEAIDWTRRRNLEEIIGPKGFGPLDGYGLLVKGFEHRQLMNMMNYNFPYYPELLENLGFQKEVDFVSAFLDTQVFKIPERVHRIAERARQRSGLEVKRFINKKELVEWSPRIGRAYNAAFINNWEYSPLTDREIKFVVDNIMLVADYRLMKIITHGEDVVGFLFAFPDISAAMQRIKGRLFPFGIIQLLREMKKTNWIALNGAGILPEFHGRGGNALLYSEMEKTLHDFDFRYADLTQVAESAVEMRSDLENLGGEPYKNHRVYKKAL